MADGDLHDQIAQLESDIEQLAETLERCRKAMLFAKVVISAGAIWLLAFLVGAVGFVPAAMVGAIAVVIGGVVLYGSNASTLKEATAAMKDAERLRADLIDRIDPRTVGRRSQ
jgi:dihydrodipicolinate synthase/N-acetylneuraminate lyase